MSILIDSIKGALFFSFFIFAGYGICYVLKKVGIGGKNKEFKSKPSDAIYKKVESMFKGKKEKTWIEFTEMISKYKLPEQKQYIGAYFKLKES